ncbi:MAG: hypothetical protein KatS3mg105_3873 [Gemmatales bacterium]|nr:MAG: hypothetical protein KatS3mg105_3873 [Gemmatales bacterium]
MLARRAGPSTNGVISRQRQVTIEAGTRYNEGEKLGDRIFRWGNMDLDDKICYCFHVTRRKLENFVRIEKPKVASQLSQCGGAGTGCGWCIPFLKQIFQRNAERSTLENITADDYARLRGEYIRSGKGKPPPGATPLPEN